MQYTKRQFKVYQQALQKYAEGKGDMKDQADSKSSLHFQDNIAGTCLALKEIVLKTLKKQKKKTATSYELWAEIREDNHRFPEASRICEDWDNSWKNASGPSPARIEMAAALSAALKKDLSFK